MVRLYPLPQVVVIPIDSSSIDTPLPAEEALRLMSVLVVILAVAADAEPVFRFDESRKEAISNPTARNFVFVRILNAFVLMCLCCY